MECFIGMPIEKIITFFCFGVWAVGTAVFMLTHVFSNDTAWRTQGMSWREFIISTHWFDVVTKTTIFAWLTMWCFRSMY